MLRDHRTRTVGPGGGRGVRCPRWRFRVIGILAELADREEQRGLHGYEPLRFRRERDEKRLSKRWA